MSDGRKIDPLATLARALEPKQPEPVRIAAAASLAKHAARLDGRLDDAQAVRALGLASEDNDAELRQMVVYALGFFGGEPTARLLRARLDDEDRFVRYNAAVALGRRGDPEARAVLREMLSPADLNKLITLESESEKHSKIEAIELEALTALQTSIKRGNPGLARSLRPEVTYLTRSGLVSVRNKALALLRDEALRDRPSQSVPDARTPHCPNHADPPRKPSFPSVCDGPGRHPRILLRPGPRPLPAGQLPAMTQGGCGFATRRPEGRRVRSGWGPFSVRPKNFNGPTNS